jgi:glycosyltransferase involved in cell wall biosynthesis
MKDSITVLTLTKGRPNLVRRCIKSVRQQDYEGEVRHLILIDDCPDTYGTLQQDEQPSDKVRWFLRPRSSGEQSGPEHLAQLRNLLVRMAETEWITFLDDDNEYEPYHLRRLMECARQTGSPAVHSWLGLFNFDGSPYLKPRWPWCREDELGKQRYQEMAQRGVVSPGSNVVRDNIDNLPYRCVDTSEWLLKREILLNHPIPSDFSYEEWINNKAEDDKLLRQLLAAKVPIVCNNVASLRYYLGGYSNNHDRSYSHSQTWACPQSSNPSF